MCNFNRVGVAINEQYINQNNMFIELAPNKGYTSTGGRWADMMHHESDRWQ
jgi:hypothetical protein